MSEPSSGPGSAVTLGVGSVSAEAGRRRTFAVISHPDAGKSTLTEALSLHARAIGQAGAVHGKAGRRSTVSDWMEMEQARGISISSSALQFTYRDIVLNLVDTPGHADFSEDTYRVLTAVDSAVMLLDAAKGLEPQTMKLFEVCRSRGVPILTVVNKWDRPGRDPLSLMDEIQTRTGLIPTPLTWPVGIAGDFRGVLDRTTGGFIKFTRTAGGASIAPQQFLDPQAALTSEGAAWAEAVGEHELLDADGYNHDEAQYLAERTTPVLFAAAVLNFGVGQLLDVLCDLAPPAGARPDEAGTPRPVEAPFSAQVFKVQAGMDSAHRDRLAFARVNSGVFHRGDVLTHEPTGRSFATKYVHAVFGRTRETLEVAYPGDVIGLVNAGSLRAGDTLYAETPVRFPPIPSFAPEHFRIARAKDPVAVQAVPARHRPARPGGRGAGAALGPPRQPGPGARRRRPHAVRGRRAPARARAATRRSTSRPCPTRSPGAPAARTSPRSRPAGAPRCSNAATARSWPCSPTAGRSSGCSATIPRWSSIRWSPRSTRRAGSHAIVAVVALAGSAVACSSPRMPARRLAIIPVRHHQVTVDDEGPTWASKTW